MKSRILQGGALLTALVFAAGCGGSGSSSKKAAANSPGAKVFAKAGCASCHTLKAADAKGQVGPNLDELKPDQATVARQVRTGGNGMPSFGSRLSSTQIDQVASFVSKAAKASGSSIAFHPDDTTIESCQRSNKPFCYRQAFGNVSYKEGPQKALELLATDDRSMPAVHGDCHQISHWVGRAGLAHYKQDAAQALSHGAMTCNSGYYHGVLQAAFGGLPRGEVERKSRVLCNTPAVNVDDFLLYQCVHGLGHGLMIYSAYDLPWSLKTCHSLRSDFDRVSCTGGVFMQNLDTTMGRSKYLKASNPLYPCNIVVKQDKYYCYLMATSRILPMVSYDWVRAAAWCRRAEKAWVSICFQSFGRDASGTSQYRAAETIRLCNAAGKVGEGDCIYGAARDFGNNYAGDSRSLAICAATPVKYKARCYEGLGTIIGALHRDEAGRRAGCAKGIPKRYERACLTGAAVL
jgi:mono/diheme cytochrome c family protein